MAKKKSSKGRASSTTKSAATSKKRGATKKSAAPKKSVASKKPVRSKKRSAVTSKKANAASKRPKTAKKRTAASVSKPVLVRRRDGAGHLDAEYAAMLRKKSLEGRVEDSDTAFIDRTGRTADNLAEVMGETWIETATSGEDENEDVFNQDVPEDEGGPFVSSTAGQEFAEGTDASNPKGAKREPFPRT